MINRHYIKPGGIDPTKKVYYNRPQIQNVPSYDTYDEGWMYANNVDPMFYPTDGIYQHSDMSVSIDYLKYFNAFGHKFRFTGLSGGYYDFNDGNYKDVNGNLSTFEDQFLRPVRTTGGLSNEGYVIDHLTGLGTTTHRLGSGAQTYYTNLSYILTNIWPAWDLFVHTDWYGFPLNLAETLYRYDQPYVLNSNPPFPGSRPPFRYDQPDIWTVTTYPLNTLLTYQPQFPGPNTVAVSKTATGSANRAYLRFHYSRTDYVLQP